MANKSPSSKPYIPSLNGLRALSVIFVILYHFNSRFPHNVAIQPPWTFPFLDRYLGVNIFFVISGYLITTLLMKEKELTQSVSLKQFYIRRTLRIFPAYYFLLAVYALLQLCNVLHFAPLSWLTSLTYTKYFYKSDWETGHLWSLSVEEHFYLLWPLLFKTFKKYNFLYAVIVIVPVFRLIANHYNISWMDSLSIFQRGDAIVFGCLLALHYQKITHWVNRLVSINRLFILLPLVLLIIVYLAGLPFVKPTVINGLITAFGNTYGTLANIAIVMIIVISINSRNWWYKFLNIPAMNFIGKISYSLYLWQQLFFSTSLGIFSMFPLNFIAIVCMALFSYYLVELPFLKIKRRHEIV